MSIRRWTSAAVLALAVPAVLIACDDPLPTGIDNRADAGGYTVEFEAIPDHLHEGDTGTLRFRVTDGASPVTGLTPEIHVQEGDGSEASYAATESDDGVYEADHDFGSAGEAHAELHFTGSDGSEAAVDFHLEISDAH